MVTACAQQAVDLEQNIAILLMVQKKKHIVINYTLLPHLRDLKFYFAFMLKGFGSWRRSYLCEVAAKWGKEVDRLDF